MYTMHCGAILVAAWRSDSTNVTAVTLLAIRASRAHVISIAAWRSDSTNVTAVAFLTSRA